MPPEARVTRFAPSPTGPLHLGHAFAALTAQERAGAGRVLLRLEDIDQSRCRPEYEDGIIEDLRWIGFCWSGPILRQSDRLSAYRAALDRLGTLGVLYPCRCRRRDILEALSAPQGVEPVAGPDGVVYPGTCRRRPLAEREADDAVRLNMGAALRLAGTLGLEETGPVRAGHHRLDPEWMMAHVGDVVLARRDMGTSYHLSVVVDDAAQGITEVTRGVDLFDASFIHVLLQKLLALPQPRFHHHNLICDEAGKRLAKRDDARAIGLYRAEGMSPADVRVMLGL